MELFIKKFNELNIDELYEILRVRAEVFVVEQSCPYQDLDQMDKNAYHIYLKDEEKIVAYLRVVEKGFAFEDVCIGRVLTTKRRHGLATQILKEGIRVAREKYDAETIVIAAQTYARGLYEKQGFRQTSEEFLEDGIPHIMMRL